MSDMNIFGLRFLISTTEQNDQLISALCDVNSVSRAKINAKLCDAVSHRPMIAKIASPGAGDTGAYL
jgi:hypothetical protein